MYDDSWVDMNWYELMYWYIIYIYIIYLYIYILIYGCDVICFTLPVGLPIYPKIHECIGIFRCSSIAPRSGRLCLAAATLDYKEQCKVLRQQKLHHQKLFQIVASLHGEACSFATNCNLDLQSRWMGKEAFLTSIPDINTSTQADGCLVEGE